MTSPPPPANLEIRPMRDDEAAAACALAARVFETSIAPLYGDEGRRGFLAFSRPAALLQRHAAGYVTWIALHDGHLVGMLHVRDSNHLSMLFVAAECQRCGYARALVETALARFVLVGPLTVNSSPNAVGFYARLGFVATAPEQLKNGIRYVPMRREFVPGTAARLPAAR